MKKIILILLLVSINLSCQTNSPEILVKDFVIDLFDIEIKPKLIVDKYLEIKPDSLNSLSLVERKKGAESVILEIRKRTSNEKNWLIPNYDIEHIKKPIVYPYQPNKGISTVKIKGIDKIENRVYVLLNSKKNEILQYFLLNEDKNKITSFSLFVKQENSGSFFSF